MEDERVEIVKSGIAALKEGGFEGLLPLVHPEFEMTTPPELASEPGTYRGIEGLRRYFDSFYEAMEDVYVEGHEYIPVGEGVVVRFSLHARGRSSGIEAVQNAYAIWTVRDGKLRGMQFFPTREEAMAAASAAQ